MSPPRTRARRALGLAALAALTTACAIGPDYERPELELPDGFARVGSASAVEGELHLAWWTLFADPTLNELIARAAARNLDVAVAAERLAEARALRRSSALDLGPIAPARAGYKETLLPQTTFQGASYHLRDREIYDAGFDATWELDLFGRLRRSLEANAAVVGAAQAARRDVLVSVLAEVARGYFELRGAQARLAVARENLENQRRTAALTTARQGGGRGTQLDVSRAESQLHATRAALPGLAAEVARAGHRIAVLLGELPAAEAARLEGGAALPALPARLAIGRPGELLQRRPDVRVAERELHAATARIGVARADYLPRLTLQGSIELNAARIAAVGEGGAEAFSFGPRLTWAAFDLGHVMAREEAAEAKARAALASYRRAVLLALQETEDALVSYGAERARLDALRESVRQSALAAGLARQRYEDGLTDLLTVLDAERRLLEGQDALAGSEARARAALVLVYKALGGGWEPFEPQEDGEEPAQ
ncbi:MAG: efflux transporter outer membrane subunit [Planctomycetota bacterium]